MIKVLVLALAFGIVSCQYHAAPEKEYEKSPEKEEYAEPLYSFEYSVHDPHTGDIKSHKEERKGDVTKGEYFLVEPDGSKRTIQYHVEGKSGFVADVHKEAGKGDYKVDPHYYQKASGHEKPEPSYNKPEPSYHKEEPSYPKPSYYH